MIHIHDTAKKEMYEDAVKTFPDECCGFLFGEENGEERTVTAITVVNNSKEGDKRRRFEISAKDYLKAEQFADENNLLLLGVYHSHPNHLPVPSEHDRIAAQTYFSYVIVSVVPSGIAATRSWRLNDSFQFEEEKIIQHQLI